jgi:hypothetical protein
MESTVIYLDAMKRPLSVLNQTVFHIERSGVIGSIPSKGHYRELRACRRSPNRKSIKIRPGGTVGAPFHRVLLRRAGNNYRCRLISSALRYAALGPSAEMKGFSFLFPGTYSSARVARLGNMPGYYRPSLTGLVQFR